MRANRNWKSTLFQATLAVFLFSAQGASAADAPVAAGRVTLDGQGNVIDASGRSVAYIVAGLAGSNDTARLTVDSKGTIADPTGKQVGKLIVGATDNLNEIAKVAIDASGNLIDRTGALVGHVVVSDGVSKPMDIRVDGSGKMTGTGGRVVCQCAVGTRGGFVDRKGQLEARLAAELRQGRLTSVQYDRLTNDVEDAARDEQQYAKDGSVTQKEEGILKGKLDKIYLKLDRALIVTKG